MMRTWLALLTAAVAISAWARPAPLIFVVPSHLVGEQNALLAVARHMGGRVQLVTAETLEIHDEVPDYVLHALGAPDEVEDLVGYKKQFPSVRLINLHDPGSGARSKFDLVLTSTHLEEVPGAVVVEGIPSNVALHKGVREENLTTVMMGGSAKSSVFTAAHAKRLAQTLMAIRTEHPEMRFLISNSRRTSDEATLAFQNAFSRLSGDEFVDWREVTKESNPYVSMLSRASRLIVTGDSMSMIADGIKTGKPVFIYAPEGSLEPRHKAFILEQARAGRVRPLDTKLLPYVYTPLDTARLMAEAVLTRFDRVRLCENMFR